MAFPASLTLVTVHGAFDLPPSGGATGVVRFTCPVSLRGAGDNSIVPPFQQAATLDASGEFSIALPATNDPDWVPVDWTYAVVATIGTQTISGTLQLNYQTASVELADLLQVDGAAQSGTTYATLAQLTAVEAQLADYLPKVAPVVTDSTFTVVRSAGGAGRWRTSGSALDIEVVGDVIESRRANQDFTGTQVNLRRMRDTGNTLVGRTEFGSTPYAAEQAIDASTGRADLGAKNSAANIQLCGYLDIATAPTTGTWATGDVVMTRIGYVRCTTGGTPGTWALVGRLEALDLGFAGWMGNSADIQASTIITTGGTPYVFRFQALAATVSAMNLHIVTPGTLLTNAYWTLHNDAGAILGASAKSADQSTNLQSGGERTMPLTVAQAVTPGAYYRARFWVTTSGGALPTPSRLCNSSSAAINAGGVLRWASAAGGLTNLASAPDNIGALTGIGTAWWAGWLP